MLLLTLVESKVASQCLARGLHAYRTLLLRQGHNPRQRLALKKLQARTTAS
jgi:hypothetical protein